MSYVYMFIDRFKKQICVSKYRLIKCATHYLGNLSVLTPPGSPGQVIHDDTVLNPFLINPQDDVMNSQ